MCSRTLELAPGAWPPTAFPRAKRSGAKRGHSSPVPKWFIPSKRDSRCAKKADTQGGTATGVSFCGKCRVCLILAGCPPVRLWQWSVQMPALSALNAMSQPRRSGCCRRDDKPMDIEVLALLLIGIVVLWLAAGEWICRIRRASRLRSVHAAGCSNSLR
jgi:hypothetical protein